MNINQTREKIRDTLARMPKLASGVGDEDSACTISAINLAKNGKVTDARDDCMCPVIHKWVIVVQDAAPPELCRDHPEWRALAPYIAGSNLGPDVERQRVAFLMERMWTVTLPALQPSADKGGFGDAWKTMCAERTDKAAKAAEMGAAVARAVEAAAEMASGATAWATEMAAEAAARAARAVDAGTTPDHWPTYDPVGTLRALLEIGDKPTTDTRSQA